ncbi:MAG: MopE-related protein [Bradymonadia bacterium]
MHSTVRTGLLLLCFTGLTGCVVETAEEIGSNAQNGEGGEHDSGLSGEGGSGGGAGGPGAYICQANNDCEANQVCVDGICTAPRPNTPSEICDQLDNDQDGTIDEGVCDPNVECQSSDDCPPDLRCVQGVCVEMMVAQNEACDGIDNDGDGTVDEQPVPTFCAVAIGECRAEGIILCEQGVETCSAQPADPDPEECNALDDDCDGLVDEGVCGPDVECRSSDDCPPGLICVDNVCAQDPDDPCGADFDQDAIGEQCDNCPQTFNPDQTDTDGDGIGDACDDDPQPEICDGIDNDLDGVVDEGAQGEVELCGDQIDNDCDGIVDEYLNGRFSDFLGEECSVGTGACFAEGQIVCSDDGANVVCGAVAGEPAPHDQSCDGIDDDCDGVNDENYSDVAPLEQCGIGACVATAPFICVAGEPNNACRIAEPAPDDATCDIVDDDCDGAVDEDFPFTNTSCGVGECVSSGVQLCNGGRVIDSCVPGQPAINDANCNGLDDDCDGQADEDCEVECQGAADCGPNEQCVQGICQ